ncbi:hypothetical protein D3C77_420480 [compost metagenome]
MAVGFTRLHRTGNGDRLAHQQKLLGDGGLTGVGVGNNGESAALRDFGGLVGHGKSPDWGIEKGAISYLKSGRDQNLIPPLVAHNAEHAIYALPSRQRNLQG